MPVSTQRIVPILVYAYIAAGATIAFPPTDQPYGQREYGVYDLEERLWSFATRT